MSNTEREEELHPAVQLLLARMGSNPEEFSFGLSDENRWGYITQRYSEFFSAAENEAVRAKTSELAMEAFHRELMDELCNGEERREQAKMQAKMQAQMKAQTYVQAGSTLNNSLQQAYQAQAYQEYAKMQVYQEYAKAQAQAQAYQAEAEAQSDKNPSSPSSLWTFFRNAMKHGA